MKRTDLDGLLAQQGKAWRDEQPADPPFEAAAAAAMDARTSRNWIAPLIAAAAVVIGAVGTTVVVRSGHSQRAENPAAVTSTTVGWAARPAGPSRSPSFYSGLSDSATATNLGSCDGDFNSRFVPDNQGGTVVLSYRGSADCALPEVTPTAQLLDSAGSIVATGGESLAIGRQGSQPIAPSQVVLVPVRVCEPSAVGLRLLFNDGETISTPLPEGLACTGGSQTGVGVTHQRSAAGGSLGSLLQEVSAPSSVAADQVLNYHVTLTNATDFAVPLSPCPTYAAALEDVLVQHDPHAATSNEQLNCAASPTSVAAHASISYDLQLDVSGVPTGPRRLVWTWRGDWPSDGFAGYPTVTVQ